MDSLITAAARALAAGDPLGALNGSPCATTRLPSRFEASRWRSSAISFERRLSCAARRAASVRGEAVARARCVVAEAEIALVSRDLGWPAKALDAARATLEAHGDRLNAAHARNLEVRRLLLVGRLDEAEHGSPSSTLHRFRPRRGRLRAGRCGDRHAAPADQGGARCARSGRARRARGGHSCADGGGSKAHPSS
jgi:hypothetical protein